MGYSLFMANTSATQTPAFSAYDLALSTRDAYSFRYYGSKNWFACALMLACRGYNVIETEGILRSVFTRYTADDRLKARGKATAADLARLLDERSGGALKLREYIDEIVLETMQPEPEAPVRLVSRDALRLAWSR